jgi:hypothetical protein
VWAARALPRFGAERTPPFPVRAVTSSPSHGRRPHPPSSPRYAPTAVLESREVNLGKKRSPLAGQGFILIGGAVGIVVGLVALYVVLGIMDPEDAVTPGFVALRAVNALLVAFPGMVLALVFMRRRMGDRIEVALREPGGTWRHGRLTVAPGHLTFQPYARQVRIPKGEPLEFDVHHVNADTGRRPSLRQLLSVDPFLWIVELDTDRGVHEVGVQKHQVDELRQRLDDTSPAR